MKLGRIVDESGVHQTGRQSLLKKEERILEPAGMRSEDNGRLEAGLCDRREK